MGPSASPDSRFLLDDWEPAYLSAGTAALGDRVAAALEELRDCRACPRDCGVNRLADERSVCRLGRYAVVASAFPHFGEEDCLRGWKGSGTIFFSSCNLRCVFCQNWDISQATKGTTLDGAGIARLMLDLQQRGCHNINLVTPEHVAPQVVEAIAAGVRLGLRIPIVYNTSAYDGLGSLRLMDGLVDIYMPDFKFWHHGTARRLARAADYPDTARQAIAEMHRQVGDLRFGRDGLARRGLLVRHLVMPGLEEETASIFGWLATEISPDTYVNIMGQYRPDHRVRGNPRYEDIDRPATGAELRKATQAAVDAGLWRFDHR